MMKNGNDNDQQPIEGQVIVARPTPKARIGLSSIKECRRELSKVYVEAKRGAIPTQDATRLAYILVTISNMIKDSDLEERIKKLEDSVK